MKRTHTCGQLNISNVNQKVLLQGWIRKIRKMGGKTFIDLRDRYGITQLVLDDFFKEQLVNLKTEYVIEITGLVVERQKIWNFKLEKLKLKLKIFQLLINQN